MKWMTFFSLLALSLQSQADIGRITKILGGKDAHIIRNGNRLAATTEVQLQEGDLIKSSDSYLVLQIYPLVQLSLARETEVLVKKNQFRQEKGKTFLESGMELNKGIVRNLVMNHKNHEIAFSIGQEVINFIAKGTEFEVSTVDEGVDLDVVTGEVEASSPLIMTFVPEMIKANEGFRFSKTQKKFIRRKMALKFKDHPGFIGRNEALKNWLAKEQNPKVRQNARKIKNRKQD